MLNVMKMMQRSLRVGPRFGVRGHIDAITGHAEYEENNPQILASRSLCHRRGDLSPLTKAYSDQMGLIDRNMLSVH